MGFAAAFLAVLARLDVASCASWQQRDVATPMAGKIVGAIVANVAVNGAVNGVTRRGAVSGAVVRFSITRVLLRIVVAIVFIVALALLGGTFAERPITTSYGFHVAKSCPFLKRLGRSIETRCPRRVG